MVPRSGKILPRKSYPNKILVDGKKVDLFKKIKILNFKWVYIYKFDKYGRFIKYEVRLMVQKNQ